MAQVQQHQLKSRINPETARVEYWSQPAGLPGIWVEPGFCSRCQPYKKCLGFAAISDEDWEKLSHLLHEAEELKEAATAMGYELKGCGE